MRELYAQLKQMNEEARGRASVVVTALAGAASPALPVGHPAVLPTLVPIGCGASASGVYVKETRSCPRPLASSSNSPLPHLRPATTSLPINSGMGTGGGASAGVSKSALVIIDEYGTMQSADDNCCSLFG